MTAGQDLYSQIAELAPERRKLLIRAMKQKGVDVFALPITPRPGSPAVSQASFAQQRLWFLDRLLPGSSHYNIPYAVRLSGPLNRGALEQSLEEVVRRHGVLRSTFEELDGQVVQRTHAAYRVGMTVLAAAGGEAEAACLVREEANRPFDLREGPLLRVLLIELGPTEHILVATMHHIVADGWSAGVFTREVAALYEAWTAGTPARLPELPIQYSDYARWQRLRCETEGFQEDLEYWKRQLSGAPPDLELPAERQQSGHRRRMNAAEPLALSAEFSEQIRQMCKREDVTPFMLLLAGFQALLHRYSGQTDIWIGVPAANRNRSELEPLVGFFVNTLVIRGNLEGDPTFLEVLSRVREAAVGALAHQDLPFDLLVEQLNPEREAGANPLFRVMFVMEKQPPPLAAFGGLRVGPVPTALTEAKFDLLLNLADTVEGFGGSFEYDAGLFEPAMISRMARHFRRLLENAVADPCRPVAALPVLDSREEHQLLVEWGAGPKAPVERETFAGLFQRQVAKAPEAVAVSARGMQWTYGELDRRSNQLARYLAGRGLGPEAMAGICLERSPEMLGAIVAVLKTGAAYLPLDASLPDDRLNYILEDAAPALLVTVEKLARRFPGVRDRLVCLDTERETIERESQAGIVCPASQENLAYVIYTSGSTGRPKGALVSHRGLTNFLGDYTGLSSLGAHCRVLQFASIGFDASIADILVPLIAGATVCVPEPDRILAGNTLVEELREHRATHVTLPPSILRQLDPGLVPGVRSIVSAGESCTPEIAERWAPGRILLNGYGPTECTVGVTFARLASSEAERGHVPIGAPVRNASVYVLDGKLRPVPPGVAGELYIGGECVGRGYLNRPDLTAERFLPDRFSGEAGKRLYRTGDRVRFLTDGQLEYLGRIDRQVKLRGYRIELEEIEAVLREQEGVRQAAVIVIGEGEASRLAAYIEEEAAEAVDLEGLRASLHRRLPEYMVPAHIVNLPALPLSASGKIDRRALPRPELEGAACLAGEPRTPEEAELARLFAETLGIPRIGIEDNFFHLGGHSLLATRLMARVRETTGAEIPLQSLFEAPTVAGLARAVEHARGDSGARRALPPVEPIPRDGDLPLSYSQQRLWFLEQLAPGAAAYNIPAAVRLQGRLDQGALEWTLNEILRRHEALRAAFVTSDGKPAQRICPELRLELRVTDLSGREAVEREAAARQAVAEETRRGFHLWEPPLMRARLLRLGSEEHVLVLVMHHMVSDGWSLGVLIGEVSRLYSTRLQGRSAGLEPLKIQYADYAAWERRWLRGEVMEEQLSYWKRQLGDLPPVLELPLDRPRTKTSTGRGALVRFAWPGEVLTALEKLGRAEGTTLFMTLLAALEVLLYRHTGQERFGIGTPVANRARGEVEGLIGFFANTLVLRADLAGKMTFLEVLHRVKETALGAYAHQQAPFEMVVDSIQPQRDLSYSPLFQVMFAWQDAPRQALELPGLKLESLDVDTGVAKFELMLSMGVMARGLQGAWEFNTDLFDETTIERLSERFRVLVESAASNAGQSINSLRVMPLAEERTVLRDWNENSGPYPDTETFVSAFDAQAGKSPEALAVHANGRAMTYGQLQRRSNQIAHYLRCLGVGPEMAVGLCLERSVELIAGLLGILKAGGAYVPLDPNYPPERLATMLRVSQARFLITRSGLHLPLQDAVEHAVCLDRDAAHIGAESEEARAANLLPGNLAYVIFTSGSTGVPKGVMIEHRSVLNLSVALEKLTGESRLGRPLRGSLNAPLSFDASVQQLVMLLRGHTLDVIPEEVRRDGEALLAYLRRNQLDWFDCVPSQLKLLLEAGWLDGGQPVPAIALPGGEAIDAETWAVLARSDRTEFYNVYGPTECTVDSTGCLASTVPGLPSIGRGLQNVELYVLDGTRWPVPIGVAGELYIAGPGVGRGYWNRADLTAERFLPCPFTSHAGARMYKTGDRVRYLADGNLEFLGRVDFQVKIRGHRIELGEIEAALRCHPGVRDAVVVVHEDPAGKRLAGYWVAAAKPGPSSTELRQHLLRALPEYMVPWALVELPALPLMANGKVDRKALPAPDLAGLTGESAFLPPSSEEERILAAVWEQLLGRKRISIRDNFFELGGDSILSIQMIARSRKAGLELTPKQVFEHPTIERLASAARRLAAAAGAEQGLVEGPVPLTPIQSWFFEQDFRALHHYNQSVLVEVRDALEREVVAASVAALLKQHDALRLRFERTAEAWRQWHAGEEAGIPLEWVDLHGLDEAGQRARIEVLARQAQRSLNLRDGPLRRVVWFDLGESRPARLLIVAHHLAIDGVSWRILFEDLVTAWEQYRRTGTIDLGPKTMSYRSWSEGLVVEAQKPETAVELDHWRAVWRPGWGALPVDRSGAENDEASADSIALALSADETAALLEAVPAARATVQEVLLASAARALMAWTGKRAIVVDLEGHGRESIGGAADVSRTCGWFTCMYPVRLELPAGSGPGETLAQAKEQLRVTPRHGLGYGLLRYLCRNAAMRNEIAALPTAQVSFNYLGQFDQVLRGGGPLRLARESRGEERSALAKRSHLLVITGAIAEGRLQVQWSFSGRLHNRDTIERVARDFQRELRRIIEYCQSPEAEVAAPSDFPLAQLGHRGLEKVLKRVGR